MKCVKRIVNGDDSNDSNDEVIRVTNEEAEKLVKEGYTYCPKHVWKDK